MVYQTDMQLHVFDPIISKGHLGQMVKNKDIDISKIKHFVNFHLVPIFLKLYVSLEKQNLVSCIVDKV